MASFGLAVFAASSLLLFAPASPAGSPGEGPPAGNGAARLILARLTIAPRPRAMSIPLQPAAQTCKDTCESDRDKCFNGCPDDAIQGSVCRDACTETLDACLKGC